MLGLKIDLPTDPDSAPQNNLPVPDFDETGFFGRAQQVTRIKKAIKGAYPVVSVLGDGGIGKTSIALKVAYELLDEPTPAFDAFVWVSAKATVLTTNEIVRINGAIQDSLGLFEAAAAEFVAEAKDANPVDEILSYLEHFRVLLILDNLETVLDQRLREFLLELPLGSKVLITSRIGLGIENSVQLAPLSDDEAANLLRAVARIRDVKALHGLEQSVVRELASKMSGHPAYIKWFVSGVQAGRRPEELLSNNELLLDFCMSNVYEYLGQDSQAVLRSMQTLPGSRGQAELAFINDFTATRIQAALLQLITTNFIQLQSRSPSQPFDNTYSLTDFGRQYLDKVHSVTAEEREWLHNRDEDLRALGATLFAENSANPFDANTVEVRGAGDFHVARLLRDAMRAASEGSSDQALIDCREAQLLSPTYHEAWRVEAVVQDIRGDGSAALAAFDRALELSPDSRSLNYFYGTYLLGRSADAAGALRALQRAARNQPAEYAVLEAIALTHLALRNYSDVLTTVDHIVTEYRLGGNLADAAVVPAFRAAVYGARQCADQGREVDALELIEAAVDLLQKIKLNSGSAAADRVVQLIEISDLLAKNSADDFVSTRSARLSGALRAEILKSGVDANDRRIGRIVSVLREKGYGFVREGGSDFFFHVRELADAQDWDHATEGLQMIYTPAPSHPRGKWAIYPRILD